MSLSLSDAKIILAPKKRMTQKQRRADNAAQLAKQKARKKQGVLVQPKSKEAFGGAEEQQTMKLEAIITKNEKGESIFKLTPDSSEAVASILKKAEVEEPSEMKQVLVEEPAKQQVLFYDPKELKTAAGEPALPTRVYDADGNEVDMTGKTAILIPPPAAMEMKEEAVTPKEMSTEQTNNKYGSAASFTAVKETAFTSPQRQDQFIIVATVATMALLVGAVSARRLRSKQFLNFCIENESLEDELAYDAAYTTQSTAGASNFYSATGYDTFASGRFGGDLRWRGDLEKFDV